MDRPNIIGEGLHCPECKSMKIIDVEERVCSQCGLVIGEIFGESSYVMSKRDFRGGSFSGQFIGLGNTVTDIWNLGGTIGYPKQKNAFADWNNQPISPTHQALFVKLKNRDLRTKFKRRETRLRVLRILKDVASMLELTGVVTQKAAYLYAQIFKGEGHVLNNVTLLAVCLVFAARSEGRNAPVAVTELARVFRQLGHYVTDRLILRGCLAYKKYANYGRTARRSEDYLERMLSQVVQTAGLPSRVQKKARRPFPEYVRALGKTARQLLADFPIRERRGLNPFILSAAIIYAADRLLAKGGECPGVLRQNIVASATGIAEYSIRDHFVTVLKPRFFDSAPFLEQLGETIALKEDT